MAQALRVDQLAAMFEAALVGSQTFLAAWARFLDLRSHEVEHTPPAADLFAFEVTFLESTQQGVPVLSVSASREVGLYTPGEEYLGAYEFAVTAVAPAVGGASEVRRSRLLGSPGYPVEADGVLPIDDWVAGVERSDGFALVGRLGHRVTVSTGPL